MFKSDVYPCTAQSIASAREYQRSERERVMREVPGLVLDADGRPHFNEEHRSRALVNELQFGGVH